MALGRTGRAEFALAITILLLAAIPCAWVAVDLWTFWKILASQDFPRGIRPVLLVIRLAAISFVEFVILSPTSASLKRRFLERNCIGAARLADWALLIAITTVILAFAGFWGVLIITGTDLSHS